VTVDRIRFGFDRVPRVFAWLRPDVRESGLGSNAVVPGTVALQAAPVNSEY